MGTAYKMMRTTVLTTTAAMVQLVILAAGKTGPDLMLMSSCQESTPATIDLK